MMWRFAPEMAMALSLLATLLGLSVAAYRDHKRTQAHKLDRLMRIGFRKASRLGWLSTDFRETK